MLFWKLVLREHARPVWIQPFSCSGKAEAIRAIKRLQFMLRIGDRLRRRYALYRRLDVGLLLDRDGIDHVAKLVILAALLDRVRPHLGDRAP